MCQSYLSLYKPYIFINFPWTEDKISEDERINKLNTFDVLKDRIPFVTQIILEQIVRITFIPI